MGLAMKTLRGKVDGQKLNQLLENKIKDQNRQKINKRCGRWDLNPRTPKR